MIRNVVWTDKFEREVKKIKDRAVKIRVRKKIKEMLEDPEMGKPLRFEMRGERSIRIPPYRLIYAVKGDTIYLLRFEHRKLAYGQMR